MSNNGVYSLDDISKIIVDYYFEIEPNIRQSYADSKYWLNLGFSARRIIIGDSAYG